MKKITTKRTMIGLVIASCLLTTPTVAATFADETNNSAAEKTADTKADIKAGTNGTVQIGTTQGSVTSENGGDSKNLKTGVIISSSKIEFKNNAAEPVNSTTGSINDSENVDTNEENKDSFSVCIGRCENGAQDTEEIDTDEEKVNFRFNNRRDGLQFDVSAISSVGDNYALAESDSSDSEFDVAISYRMQLLGLFIESPGISTRRVQGMYSMPAWGLNFYNSDDWSFDLFYQYSTRGIEGLEGIQSRNKDERAGLRMTGFFESSQFQAIYSPVSRNGQGSDGIEASISYSHNWQFRNWNYYVNAGVQYRSKEVTPYGYETFIDDDLSFSDGVNYSAEVGFEYPLTTDWVFGGFAGYNALSDRAVSIRQDSVEDGYRAGVLLTYVF
jgi:hypothetical protein